MLRSLNFNILQKEIGFLRMLNYQLLCCNLCRWTLVSLHDVILPLSNCPTIWVMIEYGLSFRILKWQAYTIFVINPSASTALYSILQRILENSLVVLGCNLVIKPSDILLGCTRQHLLLRNIVLNLLLWGVIYILWRVILLIAGVTVVI